MVNIHYLSFGPFTFRNLKYHEKSAIWQSGCLIVGHAGPGNLDAVGAGCSQSRIPLGAQLREIVSTFASEFS